MKKNITQISLLFSLLLLSSCISQPNTGDKDITNTDTEAAATIIAQAMANDSEGFLQSLKDTRIDLNQPKADLHKHLFTDERDYSIRFDSTTGFFIVNYSINRITAGKEYQLEVENAYRYRRADDTVIFFPGRHSNRLDNIQFIGNRTGSIMDTKRKSEFDRYDTLIISNFNRFMPSLDVKGRHYSTGIVEFVNMKNEEITRQYTISFNLVDFKVLKNPYNDNRELEPHISGVIEFSISLMATNNSKTTTKSLSGIIQITPREGALLRFNKNHTRYRLFLGSGEIKRI